MTILTFAIILNIKLANSKVAKDKKYRYIADWAGLITVIL